MANRLTLRTGGEGGGERERERKRERGERETERERRERKSRISVFKLYCDLEMAQDNLFHSKSKQLVCLEPSQQLRIISGLKMNFNASLSFSARKSPTVPTTK